MTSRVSSPAPDSGPVPGSGERPILALNGAEERLQLALGSRRADTGGPSLLCFQEWVVPGRGMQFLAPAIQDTMARLSLPLSELGGIACVRGPGSFTGLRLVMATALGLASSLNLPMAGLDYLGLLASSAARQLPPDTGRALFVITHSRRNQVYLQRFELGANGCATPQGPPTDAGLEQAAEAVCRADRPLAIGSGLRRNSDFFANRLPNAATLPGTGLDNATGDALLACALHLEFSHAPVEPLYLRPSDAEENLDAIAAKRGLDPHEARRRLDDLLSS